MHACSSEEQVSVKSPSSTTVLSPLLHYSEWSPSLTKRLGFLPSRCHYVLHHLYGTIGIGISEGHITHTAHVLWGGRTIIPCCLWLLQVWEGGGGGDFTSLELTKIWIKGTVTNKGQDYETMRMRLYGMYFPSCELKFSVASCRICGGRENELARLWGLGKKTVSEYGFNADTSWNGNLLTP